MSGLAVRRFRRIEDVPDTVWRALSESDSLFTSTPWSLTLRRSNGTVPVEFWAVRDELGYLAGIPVHVYPHAPSRSTYDVWAMHERDFVPVEGTAHRDRPHVLVGTRNGQRNGFLRAAGRQVPVATGRLLEAIAAGHQDAVVAMLYLDRVLLTELRPHVPDWTARFVDTAAQLTVPANGSGLDTFIATLDKRMRYRIRSELGDADAAHVTRVSDPARIAQLAPVLAPLLQNVHRRHAQPADQGALSSYIAASAHSGLRPQLLVTGALDHPTAFSLSVGDDRLLSVRVYGVADPAPGGRRTTDYPRLAVYEPLRYAMNHAMRAVDLGVGALHAKLLRGAGPVPLYNLVRFPADLRVCHRPGGDRDRLAAIRAASATVSEMDTQSWEIDQ